MGYRYVQFGAVILPEYDAEDELAPAGVRSLTVVTPGGWFNAAGSGRSPRTPPRLRVKRMLIEDTAAAARTAYNALRGLLDTRAQLWREWRDGTREWVYARLMDIGPELGEHDILRIPVELVFAVESAWWNGTALAYSEQLGAHTLLNAGNAPVRNAIITLTPYTNPITAFALAYGGLTMAFAGTVAVGTSLIINCGAKTVTNDGVDAYGNFTWPVAAHWLEIPARVGLTATSTATPSDPATIVQFAYSEQWE